MFDPPDGEGSVRIEGPDERAIGQTPADLLAGVFSPRRRRADSPFRLEQAPVGCGDEFANGCPAILEQNWFLRL